MSNHTEESNDLFLYLAICIFLIFTIRFFNRCFRSGAAGSTTTPTSRISRNHHHNRNNSDNNTNNNINNASDDTTQAQIRRNVRSTLQDREDRRFHILTSVLHKKVISSKNQNGQIDNDNNNFKDNNTIYQNDEQIETDNSRGVPGKLLLSQLSSSLRRSKKLLMMTSSSDLQLDSKKVSLKKSDIEIGGPTLPSLINDYPMVDKTVNNPEITIMTDLDDCENQKGEGKHEESFDLSLSSSLPEKVRKNHDNDSNEEVYSPKSCPICIEPYSIGDDICWSNNVKCPHAFHLDCITQWLMENDECPLCREVYLTTSTTPPTTTTTAEI